MLAINTTNTSLGSNDSSKGIVDINANIITRIHAIFYDFVVQNPETSTCQFLPILFGSVFDKLWHSILLIRILNLISMASIFYSMRYGKEKKGIVSFNLIKMWHFGFWSLHGTWEESNIVEEFSKKCKYCTKYNFSLTKSNFEQCYSILLQPRKLEGIFPPSLFRTVGNHTIQPQNDLSKAWSKRRISTPT